MSALIARTLVQSFNIIKSVKSENYMKIINNPTSIIYNPVNICLKYDLWEETFHANETMTLYTL